MVLAFSVALIIATEIHRFGNLYEINDKSIIHTTGYFNILSKRVEFGAISDIDIEIANTIIKNEQTKIKI